MKKLKILDQKLLKDWAKEIFSKNAFNIQIKDQTQLLIELDSSSAFGN